MRLQIINAMGGQIERQQDNNACLSYWLSNTVTLLYLLQRNIKPASGGTYQQRMRSPTSRCEPLLPPVNLGFLRESPARSMQSMCAERSPSTWLPVRAFV